MLPRALTLAVVIGLAVTGQVTAAGREPPRAGPPLDSARAAADKAAAEKAAAEKAAAEKAAADRALAEKGRRSAPVVQPDKGNADKRSDWRDGYRAAVSLIQRGRYDDAIAGLVALDMPNSSDVHNYIGYAHRKMGRMEQARASYERALALEPDHRGVLEYYGEWHVQMGRIDGARGYLQRIAAVCGTSCREYQDLADAITHKTFR